MNIMQGAFFCASLNRSLTLDAPTPTYISTKSEPAREKKGTWASPATALARSVLPVPGGPTRSAPFGSLAPILTYFPGLWRKSTTSCNDSLASSCPATSLNVTPVSFWTYILALLFPTPIIPPPPILLIKKLMISQKISIGNIYDSTKERIMDDESDSFCSNFTPALRSLSGRESSYTGIV